MSSPLQPFLFKDDKGDYRLYLSGWQPRTFNATDDSMYKQGRDWPKAMRKIGDPSQKLTLEEAGEALDAALKYYQPTKQKK